MRPYLVLLAAFVGLLLIFSDCLSLDLLLDLTVSINCNAVHTALFAIILDAHFIMKSLMNFIRCQRKMGSQQANFNIGQV